MHIMLTAALIIIAKIWKQRRCSSVGDWVSKLQDIQTTKYYSDQKEMRHLTMKRHRGNLKCERNQSERSTYYVFTTTLHC